MSNDEAAGGCETFQRLWQELDQRRRERGWTRERLAHEVSKLSGRRVILGTVHDQMHYGRRISWSEARWFVLALGLDEHHWEKRWNDAEKRWNDAEKQRRVAAAEPPPPLPLAAAEPPPALPQGKRDVGRPHKLPFYLGGGIAVCAVLVGLLVAGAFGGTPSPRTSPSPSPVPSAVNPSLPGPNTLNPSAAGGLPGSANPPQCYNTSRYRITAYAHVLNDFGRSIGDAFAGDIFIRKPRSDGHQLADRFYGTIPDRGISGYVLLKKLEFDSQVQICS
jgi:hypothetical protein